MRKAGLGTGGKALVAVSVLVAIAGCSRTFGLHRSASLDGPPDIDCVRRVVENAPGVVRLSEHASETEGRTWSMEPIETRSTLITFWGEEGSNINGLVSLIDERGRWSFRTGTISPSREMTDQVEATRPVMLEIEGRVQRVCGLRLASEVEERCSGSACGP